jgi:predicted dehydrogenase
MASPVRVVLLGNSFAEAVLLPALRSLGGNQVLGVAGRSLERARATAQRWELPHATDDWRTLLDLEPDLVVVATPVDLHHEMAAAALDRGAAVLCEKPFTLTLAEAEDLARRAAGRAAWIDHQLRWNPARRLLRRRLTEGFVGRLFHARHDLVIDSPAFLERPHGWWFEAERGGGALGALGSHLVDGVLWMHGPVQAVQANLSTFVSPRPDAAGVLREVTADDTAELRLRLVDGGLVTVTTSVVLPGASRWLVEVCGSEGTLRLDLEDDLVGGRHGEDLAPLDPGLSLPRPEDHGIHRAGAFAACAPLFLADLLEAVREGRADLAGAATFADGLACMRVLDAARRSSAAGGRWVEVEPGLPESAAVGDA